MGSNPVESPEFFRFMRQLLKLSSMCEDHIFSNINSKDFFMVYDDLRQTLISLFVCFVFLPFFACFCFVLFFFLVQNSNLVVFIIVVRTDHINAKARGLYGKGQVV